MRKYKFLLIFGLIFTLLASLASAWIQPIGAQTKTSNEPCEKLGWFPEDFGLKDHAIFHYDDYYYIVSTYLPREDRFVYARSQDLCHWEELPPVLRWRNRGTWDENRIWAPYVYEENGTFYMYYTGVNYRYTQSIMLAKSTNPADPQSWERVGVIFQPDHPGMIYQPWRWADCRDPMVIKLGEVYHLLYTGRDGGGNIIGFAVSASPEGPWFDWGAMIPPDRLTIPESPTLAKFSRRYYLFYTQSRRGEVFRIGEGPAGPWSDPYPIYDGWAYEVWKDPSGTWYTSYLTDHTITIQPMPWLPNRHPVRPLIR